MSHYHPFQKLCYSKQSGRIGFLLAATGPHVLCVDLENGGVPSKWPDNVDRPTDGKSYEGSRNGDLPSESMEDDPSSKRRKLSPSQEDKEEESPGSSVSIEFVSERAKGQRRKKKIVDSALPNVSHVVATLDGRHVIVVTAEDKCIRVFSINSSGRLKLSSERQGAIYMPSWTLLTIV
jgi:tRNA (guanine-N(7)-)-methyltransferase subunit TRM82